MKRLALIFTMAMVITMGLHAQTDKGTVLLGGNAVFTSADGESMFSANPNIGIFILDDAAVGASFTLVSANDVSSWALGPFIRLYLFGNDRGKFIVQSGFNIGGAKNSDTDFGFDIGAGYAAFLNESIAVELLAGFKKTGDRKGIFTIGAGFQIHYDR